MEKKILLQQLRDELDGHKVKAALFCTFNFAPRFLEGEILPLFLPEVEFMGSEVAKRIWWRRHFTELPPVTVYCDALQKDQHAPLLPYEVRRICLLEKGGKIPCYHPKISFFLLDDQSLVIMLGSFNLCGAGWCTNLECGSLLHFRRGKYMPKELKADFLRFLKKNAELSGGGELTEAEEEIKSFLQKHSVEGASEALFLHTSLFARFEDTLCRIRDDWNKGKAFRKAEVISPYFSGTEVLKGLQQHVADPAIALLIPRNGADEIGISRSLFDALLENGAVWSDFKEAPGQQFRFTHAKVYRLWGENRIFTIIGSVNFTGAGWKKLKDGANLETALVYMEHTRDQGNWLQPISVDFSAYTYADEKTLEEEGRVRYRVPDFECEMDWLSGVFAYQLKEPFTGSLLIGDHKEIDIFKGREQVGKIHLSEKELRVFASNPLVQLQQMTGDKMLTFSYFPAHKHFKFRPQVEGIKFNLQEVLDLWKCLGDPDKQKAHQAMADLMLGYIYSRLDNEGELKEQPELPVSTLNQIAIHVSGVINLTRHLYNSSSKDESQKKEIDYLLFADNVNTVPYYVRLISEDKNLLPGIKMFILLMLLNDVYNKNKLPDFYKKEQSEECKEEWKFYRNKLKNFQRELEATAQVNKNFVTWIEKQMRKGYDKR